MSWISALLARHPRRVDVSDCVLIEISARLGGRCELGVRYGMECERNVERLGTLGTLRTQGE